MTTQDIETTIKLMTRPLRSRACWLWHTWTAWEVVDSGAIIRVRHNGYMDSHGIYRRQERRCEQCGKLQLRTVTTKVPD